MRLVPAIVAGLLYWRLADGRITGVTLLTFAIVAVSVTWQVLHMYDVSDSIDRMIEQELDDHDYIQDCVRINACGQPHLCDDCIGRN